MQLRELMARQRAIYDQKNADYDNSFHHTVERFGLVAALVRVTDKMERVKRLQKCEAQTKDESLRDTVSDALNYLLMFGAEMICGTWELADESHIPGIEDNITVVHRLMDGMASDDLLAAEKVDVEQMIELWDDLCDATLKALRDQSPNEVDDLLTVNTYLAGLMALYLLELTV